MIIESGKKGQVITKTSLFIMTVFEILLLLCGCTNNGGIWGKQMLKESGVYEDEHYREYKCYEESQALDLDGYYSESDAKDEEDATGIHISFAKNNNLDINYYFDENLKSMVDTSKCYLKPGSSIYAIVSIKDDVNSSAYVFSGFDVFEYTQEGKRTLSASFEITRSGEAYKLSVSEDCVSDDISVEPKGNYKQRTIMLNDFTTDSSGKQVSLGGTWTINDKEVSSDSIDINPMANYIISYQYNSDDYFYLSSSPDMFYSDNEDGIVVFKQREANDETVCYSVELCRYFSETLVSDRDRTIEVNGGQRENIKANSEYEITQLKYGDIITIVTDKPWPWLETYRELILIGSEFLSTERQYKYTLIVPEKDGEFVFNPDDYTYEHGSVSFICFGKTVESTQILAKGSRIYYEQRTAEEGYWLSQNQNYIVVGNQEDTVAALKAIHFTQQISVTVSLPQPIFGGSIVYRYNGKKVFQNISAHSGDTITMKYEPWEGWITNIVGETTFVVGVEQNQIATADGKDVNSVFTEDEGHMPKLSVTLEKSVGERMEFSLSAAGYNLDAVRYGGGWKVTDIFTKESGKYNLINNEQKIIKGQRIGTYQPIELKINNRALQYGTAVRVTIVMTDGESREQKEVRYIDDLSEVLDPIYIYKPGTNAKATVWYKSVDISIGVVDIEKHLEPMLNTQIVLTVKNADNNMILKPGDMIEASQKVIVTIVPSSGYYLTGKGVSDNVFSKIMKYSDYQKDIHDIIDTHKAEKYCRITLDNSDSFATYTYKLGDSIVSGTINAKIGQKLQLTYQINDSNHKLKEADGGFIFGIGASYIKATETITINRYMDGKTISKEDFDIEVE